jgi:hypothetical protein
MRACVIVVLVGAAAVSRGDATVSGAAAADPFVGIAAARTRGGALAAWSEGHVYVSRDGGRTFAERPLTYGSVVVRGANVYWREERVLVVDAPGGIARREIPERGQLFGLAAGGRWVAVLAHEAVHLSDDDGRTWRALEVPSHGNYGEELLIEDDGALAWMAGSEAACGGGGQSRWVGRIGGAWRAAEWPLDAPGSWKLARGGWAYAADDGCDSEHAERLCAVAGRAPREDGTPTRDAAVAVAGITVENRDYALTDDGHGVVVAAGGRLWRVRGAHASALGDAPAKTTALAVDAGGRIFAVADGRLLRRDAGAWSPLRAR